MTEEFKNKNRLAKEAKVEELKEKFTSAKSVIFTDYRGLTVKEDTNFRSKLREGDVEYRVAKNTLINLATQGMDMSGLEQYLHGPTSVAFTYEDPVIAAKIISAYIKSVKKMEIKCGIVEGKVIDAAGVKALAELPPREVLLAQVLGTINAPTQSMVNVLAAPIKNVLYALNAIIDSKSA